MQLIERSLGYHWCDRIHARSFISHLAAVITDDRQRCPLKCLFSVHLYSHPFFLSLSGLFRGQHRLKHFTLFADYLSYVKTKVP